MQRFLRNIFASQQSGLILVILVLGTILTFCAGTHADKATGAMVNNFLNIQTLLQVATDASLFAIMAVGATLIIISGGIDLSVGSIYALAGVLTAMALETLQPRGLSPTAIFFTALALSLGIGLFCGFFNGMMIVSLRVHPFIITLGTMWVFRGIAFVISKANSILVPDALTNVIKCTFGLGKALYPVPMLIMFVVAALGAIYLSKTVMGRHIYAFGGNLDASRFCGLRVNRIQIGVFVLAGLTAGISAFLGISFYGSASCGDATGYELYVIASAVVGGASLSGGKGSAISAMLGAILITLIRQSIRTLGFDQQYEWIIVGCAIVLAVVLDQFNSRLTQRRLARAAALAKAEAK